MPPAARSAGKSSANGCGTCGWNGAITSRPEPVRTTKFAPALLEAANAPAPAQGYAPAVPGQSWKPGRCSGRDFPLQPDGTLRCPAGQTLSAHERHREADGSRRVVDAASIRSCRPCPLREQGQGQGGAPAKARQVSGLVHPLAPAGAPRLWRDWRRRKERRACLEVVRSQPVEVEVAPDRAPSPDGSPAPLSRQARAHWRLSWAARLARTARAPTAGPVTLHLFGVPAAFATTLAGATV